MKSIVRKWTRVIFYVPIIILLSGKLFSSGQVLAETPPTFVLKFGNSDVILDGNFKRPEGIAVDSAGNVYVADTQNDRIQKFDSNGNFLLKWGAYGLGGNGNFRIPAGIDVDSSGNVYVADFDKIQKFDSNGNFIIQWGEYGQADGQFAGVQDVAVDIWGNVYTVEEYNDCVQKFDSAGNFLTKWGDLGSEDGQFDAPHGVAVDESGIYVYIADSWNNRIQKFDNDGNHWAKWGGVEGDENGQFDHPTGVTIDSSGNIYVADNGNARIQKFTSLGIHVATWGGGMATLDGHMMSQSIVQAAFMSLIRLITASKSSVASGFSSQNGGQNLQETENLVMGIKRSSRVFWLSIMMVIFIWPIAEIIESRNLTITGIISLNGAQSVLEMVSFTLQQE